MSSIAIVTCLPVIYYDYLLSTKPTCSVLWLPAVYWLWLPAVYFGYLYSVLWLPVVYFSNLQSTMATCSLLRLPVFYYGYTCSLLWLPVVYYDYTYSLPSVQPRLLYAAILYYVNLICIITTSVLLSLYYLLSLPMLLFVLLTYNCIPCLVYTSGTMPTYGCYVSRLSLWCSYTYSRVRKPKNRISRIFPPTTAVCWLCRSIS